MGPGRLPLAVWTGSLAALSVLGTSGATLALLASSGDLSPRVLLALVSGACVGMALCLAQVLTALRLANGLRELHLEARRRLADPSAPVSRPRRRRLPVMASLEVGELAQVLDALHLRVRVSDELGQRHRRDAETAGAGVFELVSGLVTAEEGARGQLAAELHDTVAQSLMIARGLLETRPSSAADLAKLRDYVEDAEEQVRAVMARTRPPALREGDLATAVSGLCADLQNRYGVVVTVEWPEAPYALPLSSAITVYRFFQEGLLNVVKHADVEQAWAALRVTEDDVVAEVRDEGPGFDPTFVRPDRGRHVGLGLLRERARLSGGRVDVASGSGLGTTVRLQLPRPAGLAPVAQTGLPLQRGRDPRETHDLATG